MRLNFSTKLPTEKLVNLLLLSDSGTWGEPAEENNGFPVLRSTNIQDDQLTLDDVAYRCIPENDKKRRMLADGDILVTTSSGSVDHIGKCCFFTTPKDAKCYYFSNFTRRLRADSEKLDSRWLYYWLTSDMGKFALKAMNDTTTGLRNINISRYLDQEIPLTSPNEQKRIATILGQADAIRKKHQQAIGEANTLINSTFYDIFGDPGQNPKNWPKEKIGDYCLKVEKYDPAKVPHQKFIYIDISSLNNIYGRIESPQTLLGRDAPSRARQKIKLGDVIVATVRPNLRGTAWVTAEYDNQICSTGFSVLRPDQKHLTTDYLYTLTRDMWFMNSLISMTTGANYPAVRHKDILNLWIPVPSIHLQHDYSKKIMMLRNLQEKVRIAMQETSDLFNSLVQRAFKGEL